MEEKDKKQDINPQSIEDMGFFEGFYEDPDLFLIYGFLGFCTFAIFFLGGVLASGIIAGLFTAISMLIILFKTKKAAPKIWNTICKHSILADVFLSSLIVAFTATGVIGIIAGVSGALFTSIGLKIATDKMGEVEGVNAYEIEEIPGASFVYKIIDKIKQKQKVQPEPESV